MTLISSVKSLSKDLHFLRRNTFDKISLDESFDIHLADWFALGPAFESPAISSAIKGVRRAVWFFGALSSMAGPFLPPLPPPQMAEHVHEIHDGWTRSCCVGDTHDRERVHENPGLSRFAHTLAFRLSCVFPLSAWPLIGHIWVPRPPIPSGYLLTKRWMQISHLTRTLFPPELFFFLLLLLLLAIIVELFFLIRESGLGTRCIKIGVYRSTIGVVSKFWSTGGYVWTLTLEW